LGSMFRQSIRAAASVYSRWKFSWFTPAPFLVGASLVPVGTNAGKDGLHHHAAEESQRDPSVDGEKEQADDHRSQGQPAQSAEGRRTRARREDEAGRRDCDQVRQLRGGARPRRGPAPILPRSR
jgi:hypothetical protein